MGVSRGATSNVWFAVKRRESWHPGQAALGLRSHDTLQGVDRGREVRRLAVEEELVGGEDAAVGREPGARKRPLLRPEEPGHLAVLGSDVGGDDARGLLRKRARRDGPARVLLRPHLAPGATVLESSDQAEASPVLREAAGEGEACAARRGGLPGVRLAPEHDAHVPIPAQLDGQVVQEPGGRVVELRVRKDATADAGDDGGPVIDGPPRRAPRSARSSVLRAGPPTSGRATYAAPRQLDPHRVRGSHEEVVPLERTPQPARLDPHDGVHGGVEVLPAAEDRRGDRRLGESLPAPARVSSTM